MSRRRIKDGPATLGLALFALLGSLLAYSIAFRDRGGDGGVELPRTPPREARVFSGVVRADGRPLAGAIVTFFEDVEGFGLRDIAETGADGAFRFEWVPTGTWRTEDLFYFVRATEEFRLGATETRYAPVVVPADPAGTTVTLTPPVTVRGRVVDVEGRPVAGVAIFAALQNAPQLDDQLLRSPRATSAADGTFEIPHCFPAGAPLHVRMFKADLLSRVESHFTADDFMILRAFPGKPVRIEARDPNGRAVPIRPQPAVPLPLRLDWRGPRGPAGLSDGGPVWMVAGDDPAYLSVEVPAWPHETTQVVLWPARRVRVLVWDAWNKRGVDRVEFEVEIRPERGDWWGGEIGKVHRRFPVIVSPRAGAYSIELPKCPLLLRLTAPGYADEKLELAAGAEQVQVRMQPPRRRTKPARLRLRAEGHEGALPLLVTDPGEDWLGRVVLRDGRADLEVPPGRDLRVASGRAADGVWLPVAKAPRIEAGQRRTLRLVLHTAPRLTVHVTPPVDGAVRLVDVAYEKAMPPARTVLRDGLAEFWVRPLRTLRVEVEPESNHFAVEGEFESSQDDDTWATELRAAAGLRVRVVDRGGNPVPSAGVRVWEPNPGGRMVLRQEPRTKLADARGAVTFRGLRGGEAAVEVAAWGFRSRRIALVRLKEGEILDQGEVELDPARLLSGRVVDGEGRPLPGIGVRALIPRVDRLPLPTGGERDLYDLTAYSIAAAMTEESGAFQVRDSSPGASLVALFPGARPGFSPAAFAPAEKLTLPPAADIELDVSGGIVGIYLLLPDGRSAVLIKRDPPMSLRPLPVRLPSGTHNLFVRMRDGRWAAEVVALQPGETRRLAPSFQR